MTTPRILLAIAALFVPVVVGPYLGLFIAGMDGGGIGVLGGIFLGGAFMLLVLSGGEDW